MSTLKVNTIQEVDGSAFSRILQVVEGRRTAQGFVTATSFNNIGLSATITPSSTSSKIIVSFNSGIGSNNNGNRILIRIVRTGDDNVYVGDAAGSRTRTSVGTVASSNGENCANVSCLFVDSPNTTSAMTYAMQGKLQSTAGVGMVNKNGEDSDSSIEGRSASSIVLMELAA